MSSTVFAASKLGGDYWKNLTYPFGHNGRCVLTSIRKSSAAGASSATSPDFTLDERTPFLCGCRCKSDRQLLAAPEIERGRSALASIPPSWRRLKVEHEKPSA
jgi:hypothetical protein